MVRRWTGIIFTNQTINSFQCFQKYLYVNLKNILKFKKYVLFVSKRKRKQLGRLKEFSNYLIYVQFLSCWAYDYQEKKATFRYYYYLGIFTNSYSILNFYNYNKNARWDETILDDLKTGVIVRKPNRLSKFLLKFCNKINFEYHNFYRFLKESSIFFLEKINEYEISVKVINPVCNPSTTENIFLTSAEIENLRYFFFNYLLVINVEIYKIYNLFIYFTVVNSFLIEKKKLLNSSVLTIFQI